MSGEQLQTECRFRVTRNIESRHGRRTSAMALALSMALSGITGTTLPATATAQTGSTTQQQFSIPAGNLRTALDALASQSGITVMYSPDLVEGKATRGLSGRYTPSEGLRRLLQGSGLEAQEAGDSTFTLKRAASPRPVPRDATPGSSAGPQEAEPEITELEKMTVTGTRIRGAQVSSPIVTITQEEMRLSGQTNLGEVMRSLPQNFSGGQNPGVSVDAAIGRNANVNATGGSSVNLRGLGPDATLTLLNGTRLPYDGSRQATDVSVIPVAAIDRVEVLLDGASAIYGSDAVGGVTNIVLKRDYEGAEISARYGMATDGGYEQTQYTAVGGATWDSGGFLITGDFSRNTAVRVGQRDYLDYMPRPDATIYPASNQRGGLFSGYQTLGTAEFTLDGFYTKREHEAVQQSQDVGFRDVDSNIWGLTPALRFALPGDWSIRLHGAVGRNETSSRQKTFTVANIQTNDIRSSVRNKAEAAGVEAEGPLFALPGGEARLSIGAGYRKNDYKNVSRRFTPTAALVSTSMTEGHHSSHYGYGEINLPLVGEEQGIPLVSRLIVNGAIRYEDYDTFGDVTTPKLGLIWGLTPSFDIKASWGKSFKAPTLAELYDQSTLYLYPADSIATGAPPNRTAMVAFGGNTNLDPERAEILTVGFVANPKFLPGLTLELNWFDIDYTSRVVLPLSPLSEALVNPAFADFVAVNPTTQQQNDLFANLGLPVGDFTGNFSGPDFTPAPYDPTDVYAILDARNANAAGQHARGVDFNARYDTEAFGGRVLFSANATWLDAEIKLTDISPELPAAGVIYFPPKLRGRLGASWSRESVTLAAHFNHIGGVDNTRAIPNSTGGSMNTLDLVASYQVDLGALGEVGFNLAMTNVFDRSPPFLLPNFPHVVSYDSTNYSPLGRVISATITKRF